MHKREARICLIFTGGTIGMQRRADGTLQPPDNPRDFLRVAPELDNIIELEFVPLMNKDSTNINPTDWTAIAEAIFERRNDGFDGFVVAHGTDTMHFSASAVAFALGAPLPFPIVFTGSQTIPEVSHGDARINLIRACKVASLDIGEVVISFGDYVFRGCRAQKKDEAKFDAFESPAFFPLAYITEQIVLQPVTHAATSRGDDWELNAKFASGIAQVSLIPGLEPEMLEPVLLSEQCKGLILLSFGAGNVPHEDPYSFVKLIHGSRELNKPVVIASQFPANATLHTAYEPGKAARNAGAIPTGNMTNSCAVAKFRWVMAQVEERLANAELEPHKKMREVERMMQTDYVGEMDTPNDEKGSK
ncbi:MAG: asparaginase [Planctomycetota bacterium]